ncbi:hypothetical protein ES703_85487 [subsurface metagenome]
MGLGRAGGNYNPVEVILLYHLGYGLLCILGAGIKIVSYILHIGKRPCVVTHRRHIHNAAYIDTALAHEYAYTGSFAEYIPLFRDLLFFSQGVSCLA